MVLFTLSMCPFFLYSGACIAAHVSHDHSVLLTSLDCTLLVDSYTEFRWRTLHGYHYLLNHDDLTGGLLLFVEEFLFQQVVDQVGRHGRGDGRCHPTQKGQDGAWINREAR